MAEAPKENEERRQCNLQGLLHFCTEMTASEDPTQSSQISDLDPERREFLDNVLEGMGSDVPKILLGCINTLSNDDSTILKNEAALEELVEHLDDLNYAIDFYKLGGCPALIKHLKSNHSSLRHLSAQLIGDVCQNNNPLQENMISLDALSILLKMILFDDERLCRVRAMYALSCIVRENKKAQKSFIEKDGFSTLLKIIEEMHEVLLTKAIFLLNSLYQEKNCKAVVKLMGFSRHLVTLLCSNTELEDTAREYAVKLLLQMASDHLEIREAIRSNKRTEFIHYLNNRIILVNGQSEFQEEESYIKELLAIIEPN